MKLIIITRAINVSENDKVTAQAWHKAVKGSSAGRGESSDDCGMWTETVQMLRAVVYCLYTWAAAMGKALWPMFDRRVWRTTSDDDDAERRRRLMLKSANWRSSSARCDGAAPYKNLYTKTASLKSIRSAALSQCSWRRSGVMWSYLNEENTSRAAEFNIDQSRFSIVQDCGKGGIAVVPPCQNERCC